MERYYLGSNTYKGFNGFYEDAIKNLNEVVLLKGGAGTGKSTLMKKVLNAALERGYDCEEWHCSGDPKSLDGVYVKGLNRGIIDATSPHAVEPQYPMVKERMVNLLDFCKTGKIKPYRKDIEKLVNDKKHSFSVGYEHLNIAFCHYKQIERIVKDKVDEDKILKMAKSLKSKIKSITVCDRVTERRDKRYLRAITPDGVQGFDNTSSKELIYVKGEEPVANLFFAELLKYFCPDVIYYNPLVPEVIDGFMIGDLILSVYNPKVENKENEFLEVVELGVFEKNLDKYALSQAKVKLDDEIALAVNSFDGARRTHMDIERLYIQSMDFVGMSKFIDMVIQEFFNA